MMGCVLQQVSHSPAPLPRDKSQKFPYPCISQSPPKVLQILYFRQFLTRSAQADNQKIVHKIISWINSWHKKKTFAHQNRVGSPGLSSAWREVWSPTTRPSQSSWRIFPEVKPTCCLTKWPKLNSAQPSSGHVQLTLVCKRPGCF